MGKCVDCGGKGCCYCYWSGDEAVALERLDVLDKQSEKVRDALDTFAGVLELEEEVSTERGRLRGRTARLSAEELVVYNEISGKMTRKGMEGAKGDVATGSAHDE